MKNRNVKVVDDHSIDRNANIMFAMDLDGSEYVVYWIERDETSNNIFVSKVLKNIDGTYNMINIDDDDKKKEVADTVKMLISNAVSDQNDKLNGTSVALSNGKAVKFIDVLFNKEQNINISKTYITTVKKEVTKVAEDYYDVIIEENKVADVLPSVSPVVEPVAEVFPELGTVTQSVVEPVQSVITESVVAQPVVEPTPVVVATPVIDAAPIVQSAVSAPVMETISQQPVVAAQPAIFETPVMASVQTTVVSTPIIEPVVAVSQPVVEPTPVVMTTPVVEVAPVVQPAVSAPVMETIPQQPVVAAQPVPETPVVTEPAPLVFDATKESNLNAALGEVASSTAIQVENIQPVREFGVDAPIETQSITAPVVQQPIIQPETNQVPKDLTEKAGFANSKFFVVVAISFFLASCIFLGYEVYKYFQLTK